VSLESVYRTFASSTGTAGVTVYNLSTVGAQAQPIYATGVQFDARVVESNKLVTDPSGREVVATHRVWILSTSTAQWSITTESAVRLSGDSATEKRKVVSIERPPDFNGNHHTALNLGANRQAR
jgi:hypothetical protein